MMFEHLITHVGLHETLFFPFLAITNSWSFSPDISSAPSNEPIRKFLVGKPPCTLIAFVINGVP